MNRSAPQFLAGPREKMPRIAYLESIRGLAALQVLLLHFLAAFAPNLVFGLPAGAGVAGYIHLSPLYFLYDGYSAVYRTRLSLATLAGGALQIIVPALPCALADPVRARGGFVPAVE
jgi:hypothetical protein